MLDKIKCKLGLHKPKTMHFSVKHKCRTTNKGRSKKRYYSYAKTLYTEVYCERCGKVLKKKSKLIWRF